jgi:hypothetical protein
MHLSHRQVFSPRLPADPAMALKSQTDEQTMLHTTPRRAPVLPLPKRLPAKTREQVEDAIERLRDAQDALIAYLDTMDGDPDIEPAAGFDEPEGGDVQDGPHDPEPDERELGWSTWPNQEAALKACRGEYRHGDTWDTRDTDRESDPSDREPSLGSRHCIGLLTGSENRGFDQTGWAGGGTDDREEERHQH